MSSLLEASFILRTALGLTVSQLHDRNFTCYLLAFPEKLNLTACKYSDWLCEIDQLLLAVPTSNLYAQLNGLQLSVDPASVLWISLFSRGLLHTLDQVKAFYHLQDSSKADEHVDIRMDATQLKVNMVFFFCLVAFLRTEKGWFV